jgi:LAO/AO transport system kinase
MRREPTKNLDTGHHGPVDGMGSNVGSDGHSHGQGQSQGHGHGDPSTSADGVENGEPWTPEVVETVATAGEGIDDLIGTLAAHREYLETTGRLREKARTRYAEEIRTLVRADVSDLVERELDRRGGIESLAEAVLDRETDPYTVADEVVAPIRDCFDERTDEGR